ncbi:MAG TPA: organic solvent tolerance protein OstA, partial [Thermoguttaceae bacterium]|nr:organic solvent tolerance protein OstA [Thermoguttaceae bacterium]
DEGQQIVTVGGFLSRPPRGNVYMGLRLLEGPVDGKILSFAYNYWMSPKWVSSLGASVDLGDNKNIGQRFTVTRIGEALLVSAGFNVDASRGNVGVMFAIEPRFLPKTRLGQEGGVQIPVAGAEGLE